MLQIAICDDSEQEIEKIENMLLPLSARLEFECDIFCSGEELLKSLNEDDILYDIYLLDIEMGEINGLDIAKKIREKDLISVIIFLSGYPRYVFKAYDVIVFNFLLKPVKQEKLEEIVFKAATFLHHTKEIFCFSFNKVEKSLLARTILYFERNKRKVLIHTEHETEQCYMKMETILEHLDNIIFARISYSMIVNLHYVKNVKSGAIELRNGTILSISRKYKDEVKQKHFTYLKKRM